MKDVIYQSNNIGKGLWEWNIFYALQMHSHVGWLAILPLKWWDSVNFYLYVLSSKSSSLVTPLSI